MCGAVPVSATAPPTTPIFFPPHVTLHRVPSYTGAYSPLREGDSILVKGIRYFRDRRHARLLERSREGDSGAFRRLYRELHGPLSQYVASRVSSPDDGEDLTARVFHRFLEHLGRFDSDRGSVFSWLMTMARNAIIDHYRKEARKRETLPIDDLAEVLAGQGPDPLDNLLHDEQARLVWDLLGEYPAETREIFSLRFGQGMTCREIAALTGMGEAAVKQRFSRTLRALRSGVDTNPNKGGEVDYAV